MHQWPQHLRVFATILLEIARAEVKKGLYADDISFIGLIHSLFSLSHPSPQLEIHIFQNCGEKRSVALHHLQGEEFTTVDNKKTYAH